MAGHPRVLMLLQKENSMIAVARDIGVSREAIFQLKRSAALLPPGMIPKRKSGSGAPKKTTPRTDKLLKREITSYPFIASVELKKQAHQASPHSLNQGNSSSNPERSLSIMSSSSQEAHVHCSNEKEKAQLSPEISTLNSFRME